MEGTVEVTDLFKGAFLLCNGADLVQVRVRNNGRRIATFLITGKDLDRLDSDYRCGRALVTSGTVLGNFGDGPKIITFS